MKKMTVILILIILVLTPLQAQEDLDNMLLFSGNANKALAEKIAAHLNIALGNATVSRFNDGEINIKIHDNVRKKDVFIIQSTCPTQHQSINDNFMELFLLIRTMKRTSARSITVVIPYYGYARQDRKVSPRVPISAADVAYMIEKAGADRIVTIDLHCGQIQGFFTNAPVDNLYAAPIFISHFTQKQLINPVIVSPDAGGVERVNKFRELLAKQGITANMALISKQRAGAGVIDSMNLIGDVSNADAIIVDDICDTGGTLIKAAELLKASGARRVFAVITHPVFSNNALKKIGASIIDEMIVTDTIPLRDAVPGNVCYLSVSKLLGEAMRRIQSGKSVSALFE